MGHRGHVGRNLATEKHVVYSMLPFGFHRSFVHKDIHHVQKLKESNGKVFQPVHKKATLSGYSIDKNLPR